MRSGADPKRHAAYAADITYCTNKDIGFDYQGATDFKFAGLDVAGNKLVMGHRDAGGWHVHRQGSGQGGLKADAMYNMLVAVNGLNATLLVNNNPVFSHTYAPRVVDGWSSGLNWGLAGVDHVNGVDRPGAGRPLRNEPGLRLQRCGGRRQLRPAGEERRCQLRRGHRQDQTTRPLSRCRVRPSRSRRRPLRPRQRARARA